MNRRNFYLLLVIRQSIQPVTTDGTSSPYRSTLPWTSHTHPSPVAFAPSVSVEGPFPTTLVSHVPGWFTRSSVSPFLKVPFPCWYPPRTSSSSPAPPPSTSSPSSPLVTLTSNPFSHSGRGPTNLRKSHTLNATNVTTPIM